MSYKGKHIWCVCLCIYQSYWVEKTLRIRTLPTKRVGLVRELLVWWVKNKGWSINCLGSIPFISCEIPSTNQPYHLYHPKVSQVHLVNELYQAIIVWLVKYKWVILTIILNALYQPYYNSLRRMHKEPSRVNLYLSLVCSSTNSRVPYWPTNTSIWPWIVPKSLGWF